MFKCYNMNFRFPQIMIIIFCLNFFGCSISREDKVRNAQFYIENYHLDDEFIDVLLQQFKINKFFLIEIDSQVKISYYDSNNERKYLWYTREEIDDSLSVNDVKIYSLLKRIIDRNISSVYVVNNLIELYVPDIGFLLNVNDDRNEFYTDYGTFSIDTFVSFFNLKEENEWAYKINNNWYLVNYQSNL